ncbi:MAG: hypothetical protein ACLFTK_09190 [Anaerolineales bacterium]
MQVFRALRGRRWWVWVLILVPLGVLATYVTVAAGWFILTSYSDAQTNSVAPIRRWFDDGSPAVRAELTTVTQQEPCPGAPFILPSDGFIGLLWRDPAGPYHVLNRHTGVDVFGDGAEGEVPVYAVYDGWLTRLPDWLATVIIRHDDPLQPGRTIWTYYTHLAAEDGTESFVDDAFPPGTSEMFVEQGTLLGYQGEYNGGSFEVGLHVHFSIVTSEADGSFKNEADLANTLDPSPYFGMPVNIDDRPARPITCTSES